MGWAQVLLSNQHRHREHLQPRSRHRRVLPKPPNGTRSALTGRTGAIYGLATQRLHAARPSLGHRTEQQLAPVSWREETARDHSHWRRADRRRRTLWHTRLQTVSPNEIEQDLHDYCLMHWRRRHDDLFEQLGPYYSSTWCCRWL